jgi:hypothetical protein
MKKAILIVLFTLRIIKAAFIVHYATLHHRSGIGTCVLISSFSIDEDDGERAANCIRTIKIYFKVHHHNGSADTYANLKPNGFLTDDDLPKDDCRRTKT